MGIMDSAMEVRLDGSRHAHPEKKADSIDVEEGKLAVFCRCRASCPASVDIKPRQPQLMISVALSAPNVIGMCVMEPSRKRQSNRTNDHGSFQFPTLTVGFLQLRRFHFHLAISSNISISGLYGYSHAVIQAWELKDPTCTSAESISS